MLAVLSALDIESSTRLHFLLSLIKRGGDQKPPPPFDDINYINYSRTAAALRWASSRFLMSSGDSFGRSMVRVTLLIFPVNVKGGW